MRNILSLFMLCCLFGCSDTCVVTGRLNEVEDGATILVLSQPRNQGYDTVTTASVRNGMFEFQLSAGYFGEAYELQVGNIPGRILFFAEKEKVQIEGDRNSLFFSVVSGTEENDKWGRYQEFMQGIVHARDAEMFSEGMNDLDDSVRMVRQREIIHKYNRRIEDYQDSLIGDGRSLAALYIKWKRHTTMDYPQLNRLLMKFRDEMTQNRYYLEMQERSDVLKRIATGSVAPLFSAQAPDGSSVSLADFQGKFTILDFWASWCQPCRAETVYMKKLYEQFQDKGLEIFSVSIDKNESDWKKAVEKDRMNWNQGILLNENKTKVTHLYGIVGIPAIWVIDPEGKIIAKGLRGERLVEFCSGLFEP